MCQYCKQLYCPPRCPNFIPPKSSHSCSICGEGIYDGEEYIKNDNGEYRHLECFYGIKDLLEWLGYEIKTMDNYDESY